MIFGLIVRHGHVFRVDRGTNASSEPLPLLAQVSLFKQPQTPVARHIHVQIDGWTNAECALVVRLPDYVSETVHRGMP